MKHTAKFWALIILVLIAILIAASCSTKQQRQQKATYNEIIEVSYDSCSYLFYKGVFIHKANCKNQNHTPCNK